MKYYGTKDSEHYGFYLEPFDSSVEITDEYWQELLDAQSMGKIIKPDDTRFPMAVECVPTCDEQASIIRRERDRLLTGCDWTRLPDSNLTEEEKKAFSAYRQALRDVPQQLEFPSNVTWPKIDLLLT